MFSLKKILVVGSANVDFVIGVRQAPELGETILCRSFRKTCGGKGANQAYACGRLGGDTAFLNAVGDDPLGGELVRNLQQANVDTRAIRTVDGVSTGMAVVCVDEKGNNSIIVIPGANNLCDVDYLRRNRARFEESDIVLLQMEIPFESVCYAVELASGLHKTVILNPAPAPDSLPDEVYAGLDYLTPNESEFKRLTGCPTDEVEELAVHCKPLLEKGTRNNTDSEPTEGQEGYRFVSFQLYDALVKWDASSETEAGKIIPGLATSWEQNPENPKRWTFHLREGVKFHDGTDFNADCVIFALDRVMNPDFEYYSTTCAASVGSFLANIESYAKVDDYTITIDTVQDNNAYLIYDLPYIMIPSMEAVKEKGDGFADAPVGSGPFRFVSKIAGQELVMERNENYWGNVPQIKTLILKPISDASARLAALQSGEVDWAEVVPVESLESLKSQGYQVKLNDYPHAWLYIMNTESGPFADARVRQAFSMSINREGLCNDILQGVGTPLAQLMYPGSPWYAEGVEEYTYNPERAKELLAEAGYPDGFTTTFVCPTSGSGNMFPQIMNEYIQKCAEEVGIHIELDMSESERVWDVMKVGFKDEYADVGALNTSFYTMFPNVFQKFAGTGGSFNTGKYSNPEYDACIEAAYAATDEAESTRQFIEAEKIFTEELPWVIVCNDRNLRVLAPNVQNFAQSQTWYVDLTTVTVE